MGLNATISHRSSKLRSAVTNQRRNFVDGNGRSGWARRHRDLIELHLTDLGPAEALSEAQHSMCRRIATIEVELERMEGALSKGDEIDLDLFNRIAGNLRRLLESIGIERRVKDVTPTLAEYLAAKREAAE